MNEEGLFGSRYECRRVLEMDVEQVLVQFSEFVSEDPEICTRGVGGSRSRHAGTAARATRGFLANAEPGAELEIFFDGGW